MKNISITSKVSAMRDAKFMEILISEVSEFRFLRMIDLPGNLGALATNLFISLPKENTKPQRNTKKENDMNCRMILIFGSSPHT